MYWHNISAGLSLPNLQWVSSCFHWSFIGIVYCRVDLLFFFAAEVVLSLLIESFEFSPSEKEIFWQLSKLVTPIVVGEGTRPQLPVVVKSVHRNSGLRWFEVYPDPHWYVYYHNRKSSDIFTCVWLWNLKLLHCKKGMEGTGGRCWVFRQRQRAFYCTNVRENSSVWFI